MKKNFEWGFLDIVSITNVLYLHIPSNAKELKSIYQLQ